VRSLSPDRRHGFPVEHPDLFPDREDLGLVILPTPWPPSRYFCGTQIVRKPSAG
jgi:hypothetical protein